MKYAQKEIYHAADDETYRTPVIDFRGKRTRKIMGAGEAEYLYIHGYFAGTNVKFIYCFPEKENYRGRFFQHLSPFPGPDEEMAALDKEGEDDMIAFCLLHGACYVESNMGSSDIFGDMADATIIYKSSAAVAAYCRTIAQEIYGKHKMYGIVFGGSGGGYKTMSCIENADAWDGAVPFVIGSPMSLPNCLTVPAHGSRLLRHSWPKVVDALEPGGSGDIYAGLNEEEAEALREITSIGFPPRMTATFGSDDDGSLPVLTPRVKTMDPTYFTDFWTVPGYLGADPDGSAARDRICMTTKVMRAGLTSEFAGKEDNPGETAGESRDGRNGTDDAWQKMMTNAGDMYLEVEDVPEGDDLFLRGVDIVFLTGGAAGKKLRLKEIKGKYLIPGAAYGADDSGEVLALLKPGDEVRLDNSDYIAIQTYHRHQIPEDRSFHAWDQYLGADGKPLYPQRNYVIAYDFTCAGCGSVQDGKIQGKVAVVNSLMDSDFPWQADWYRHKVEDVYGQEADECFRIYYNDNCPHGDVSETDYDDRVVSYLGMLHQALLDVADWAEEIAEPQENTGYELTDNQVVLKEKVSERHGLQPMVRLFVEKAEKNTGESGGVCAENNTETGLRKEQSNSESIRIKAGETVTFTAVIDLPEGAGTFESADWRFEGEAYAPAKSEVLLETVDGFGRAVIRTEHVFAKPGTYFPVVRVISNRNPQDAYTRLRNLCRARVVVKQNR